MSPVLAVTGMHRSGTSLVANYLDRAGVDMGAELIPADVGNPHGYYEDAVLHDLHRRLMRKGGVADAFTVTKDQLPLPFDDADVAEARTAVERRGAAAQWGWKEPRTALYLDLWSKVFPDATFLFVFRRRPGCLTGNPLLFFLRYGLIPVDGIIAENVLEVMGRVTLRNIDGAHGAILQFVAENDGLSGAQHQ